MGQNNVENQQMLNRINGRQDGTTTATEVGTAREEIFKLKALEEIEKLRTTIANITEIAKQAIDALEDDYKNPIDDHGEKRHFILLKLIGCKDRFGIALETFDINTSQARIGIDIDIKEQQREYCNYLKTKAIIAEEEKRNVEIPKPDGI